MFILNNYSNYKIKCFFKGKYSYNIRLRKCPTYTPSCAGLPDGFNINPLQIGSTNYIICLQERVIAERHCQIDDEWQAKTFPYNGKCTHRYVSRYSGTAPDFFRTVPEKLTDITNIILDLAMPTTNVKAGSQPRWNVHLIPSSTKSLACVRPERPVLDHNNYYNIGNFISIKVHDLECNRFQRGKAKKLPLMYTCNM